MLAGIKLVKNVNKIVFFALFGLLFHFQLILWSSDKGFFAITAADNKLVQQLHINTNLATDNLALKKEVDAFRRSDAILEQQARLKLGYVKPGERYYSY